MKVDSYCVQSPMAGLSKQYCILVMEGNCAYPLMYLQKPKWVPEDQWENIVKSITITLPRGYEIKHEH